MKRLLVAVLSAALLGLVTVPAHTAMTVPEQRVVELTNKFRENNQLRTLGRKGCLRRAAQRHARRMAEQQRLFHQSPARLRRVMRRCGMSRIAENVATGFSTPRRVVRAWKRSPAHRAHMLDPGWQVMVAGMASDSGGRRYWVQMFAGY
ncbi:CAP domain-containing protein [Nocardioides limicola]|uniref:CAP domain-containing protein n=1 Tax=Nocardioides limicola TaxID=2803368 RepID=UPI00193BA35C|nr:CAP domain-containing protein [Nocardioides sp. DJM-14]